MKKVLKYLLTGVVIAIAVVLLLLKYWDYVVHPWTRNGQVRAEVIQITPRVSAPIVELPIEDNQFVKAGDLLFRVDPRTFEAALEQARGQYERARDNNAALDKQVEAAEAQVEVARASVLQAESAINEAEAEIAKNKAELQRQEELLPRRATSQRWVEHATASYRVSLEKRKSALASLSQSRSALLEAEAALAETRATRGAPGDDNATIRVALAAVREAELNLEFTRVRAPVDGYVTNLNLRLGSQAVANQPALALVDVNSFWVYGFFRETVVGRIGKGDRAVVTLMTYPDTPIDGHVDSVGWGIAQSDGSTGFDLLPTISPTFEWIRLAQRLPVRIHLEALPEGIALRVGTTCSVLVMAGTAGQGGRRPVPPAPSVLQ